jgi:hypothetical protein
MRPTGLGTLPVSMSTSSSPLMAGYRTDRSYAIASAHEDSRLALMVERIEGGEVSPCLTEGQRTGGPARVARSRRRSLQCSDRGRRGAAAARGRTGAGVTDGDAAASGGTREHGRDTTAGVRELARRRLVARRAGRSGRGRQPVDRRHIRSCARGRWENFPNRGPEQAHEGHTTFSPGLRTFVYGSAASIGTVIRLRFERGYDATAIRVEDIGQPARSSCRLGSGTNRQSLATSLGSRDQARRWAPRASGGVASYSGGFGTPGLLLL